MENLSRRSLLSGLGAALVAAPLVVKADSLMKLRGALMIGEGPCSVQGMAFVNGVLRPVIEFLGDSDVYTRSRWDFISKARSPFVNQEEMERGVEYCNLAIREREFVNEQIIQGVDFNRFEPLRGLPVAFKSECFIGTNRSVKISLT